MMLTLLRGCESLFTGIRSYGKSADYGDGLPVRKVRTRMDSATISEQRTRDMPEVQKRILEPPAQEHDDIRGLQRENCCGAKELGSSADLDGDSYLGGPAAALSKQSVGPSNGKGCGVA